MQFPLAALPTPSTHPQAPSLDAHRLRVLILEDDELVLNLYTSQLAACGHLATAVMHPLAALAALHFGSFDILLTDLHMSGMNGFDLIRAVRRRGWHIPIVATSGWYTEDALPEDILEDVTALLGKPTRVPELLHAIEAAAAGAGPLGGGRTDN